jgi:hypothetical protein
VLISVVDALDIEPVVFVMFAVVDALDIEPVVFVMFAVVDALSVVVVLFSRGSCVTPTCDMTILAHRTRNYSDSSGRGEGLKTGTRFLLRFQIPTCRTEWWIL